MITKTDLTIGPQLGSQMGQYAGLYSLAKKLNTNIVLFDSFIHLDRGIKILRPFNKLSCDIIPNNVEFFNSYRLKDVILDENVFLLDRNKNWDIQGLFHLYHYWDEYRLELLNEFTFTSDILRLSHDFINNIDSTKPIVSMHFRRTDYLQVSSLNLDMNYYIEAYNIMMDKVSDFTTIVFSDDIEWCKNNVIGDNIVYSDGHTQYEDMCIMSLCNHNIIANSTFSWWGAYLNNNPDKIVICPDRYVGGKDCDFINGNYYPSDWISIKV